MIWVVLILLIYSTPLNNFIYPDSIIVCNYLQITFKIPFNNLDGFKFYLFIVLQSTISSA